MLFPISIFFYTIPLRKQSRWRRILKPNVSRLVVIPSWPIFVFLVIIIFYFSLYPSLSTPVSPAYRVGADKCEIHLYLITLLLT
jgi:hypothetical protein